MRIDNLAYPVIPQYIQEIRPDNNEEKTGRNKTLKYPPALPFIASGLLKQKDRSFEDSGTLVTLYNSDFSAGVQTPADLTPAYAPSNNMFQVEDQYFTMVRSAYNSFNNKEQKGRYVDKFV
jgi:hypothetical protein